MNIVMISGNLTRDPEVRTTRVGTAVLNFSVAVNDRRKNQQTGEWENVANYVDCIMFGKRAESLSKIIGKGSRVYVEGRLSYSSWEDKNGGRRSKLEVVANDVELPPRARDGFGQVQQANQVPRQGVSTPMRGGYQQYPDVYDDDISFG